MNISTDNYVLLKHLIDVASQIKTAYNDENFSLIKQLKITEDELFKKIDNPSLIIDLINDHVFLEHQTINDLELMDDKKLIIERIKFRLNSLVNLNNKLVPFSNEEIFINSLNKGINDVRSLNRDLDYRFRHVFFYLLNHHIDASNNMSNEYITLLNEIKLQFSFKYNDLEDILINNKDNDISSLIKTSDFKNEKYEYNNDYFIKDELEKEILVIINKILNVNDSEFENEEVYANAICKQIYLRSLFLILDDYHFLARYDDIYNQLKVYYKHNTTAKNIISTAFVSNYHDQKEISKSLRRELNEKE